MGILNRGIPPNLWIPGESVKRQLLKRAFQALTGLLLGLAIVLWFRPGVPPEQAERPDSYFLPSPLQAPEFELTAHTGERVGLESFPQELLAIFFGYTSCPDVCPLTLTTLSRAFREMGEDGHRIQVLLITVDPERDTPDRLRQYLAAFHPSFLGLTGTEEEIRAVADELGVFFMKSGEGEGYTVDHTGRTFIVDRPHDTLSRAREVPLTFPVTATPQEVARDLTLLLEKGAS
jgi:protein SCO1/2